jgi:lysozyme
MTGVKSKAVVGGAVALAIGVITYFEGFKQEPYRDPAGIPTICYGHTGTDVVLTMKARTPEQCREVLNIDLQRAWDSIDLYVRVPLHPWTRAALASFVFNVGADAFEKSTLLTLINQGRVMEACNELLKWTKANKQELRGLIRRREAERRLCLGKAW